MRINLDCDFCIFHLYDIFMVCNHIEYNGLNVCCESSLEDEAPLAAEDLLTRWTLCNGLQELYDSRLCACH